MPEVNWVKTYNYYQYVKCLIAVMIFVMDMYVLVNYCESWISRVESQVRASPNEVHFTRLFIIVDL